MPLPTPVAEKLSQRSADTPSWFSQLILFSGTIFVVSMIVFGGLEFGYKPYLTKQLDALDAKIEETAKSIPAERQEKLISFYSQIENAKTAMDSRFAVFPVFRWLEENMLVGTTIAKLSIFGQKRTVNVSGYTKTLPGLYSQIQQFQSQKNVKKVSFSNTSQIPTGGWGMDLIVAIDSVPKAEAEPALPQPLPSSGANTASTTLAQNPPVSGATQYATSTGTTTVARSSSTTR